MRFGDGQDYIMTQHNSTVGGSYRCRTGTMMCRKLADTGENATLPGN
jgi:hypothetical protein